MFLRTASILLLAISLFLASSTVRAQEDTVGPILHRVWAMPTRINTTDERQVVTFFFEVTDNLSGFNGSANFIVTMRRDTQYGCGAPVANQANVYACTVGFHQFSEYGDHYIVEVSVSDEVGNETLSRRTEVLNGEVREGICNSGRMPYAECAPWLDAILFTNDPDFTPAKQYMPLLKAIALR
jgi:hypothetical protein